MKAENARQALLNRSISSWWIRRKQTPPNNKPLYEDHQCESFYFPLIERTRWILWWFHRSIFSSSCWLWLTNWCETEVKSSDSSHKCTSCKIVDGIINSPCLIWFYCLKEHYFLLKKCQNKEDQSIDPNNWYLFRKSRVLSDRGS